MTRDLLTIGMATRGEFDSVYFTLEALHTYHPGVRYLVVYRPGESRCREGVESPLSKWVRPADHGGSTGSGRAVW